MVPRDRLESKKALALARSLVRYLTQTGRCIADGVRSLARLSRAFFQWPRYQDQRASNLRQLASKRPIHMIWDGCQVAIHP